MDNYPRFAVIGIDPGANSGIAVVSVEQQPRLLVSEQFNFSKARKGQDRTPTEVLIRLVAAMIRQDTTVISATIEDQYVFKNVRSALTLAHNAGRWEEACRYNGIDVEYVLPSHWQRLELSGVTGRKAKRDVLKRAARDITERCFGVRLSIDAADAALIGRHHARKTWAKKRRVLV